MVSNKIGDLYITLSLNDRFSTQLQSSIRNMTRITASNANAFGAFMNRIDAGILGAQGNLNNLATTATNTQKQIVGAQKKMASGWGAVFKRVFDLKAIVGQILHYITFSIGVQMVRMIEQSIRQMIDIFRQYEKAIVNATAVSGYLGDSFDTARTKIDQMTRELASKTIFTATEVAEAMYSIASAGIDPLTASVEELIPILKYAQATQTDLANATEDLLTVMKQFKLGLDDLGIVTDTFTALITNSFMTAEHMADAFKQVGQIAGELDQDFVDVAAALTLLRDRGYQGGQAGQRLNMIFTQLLDPTDEARRTIASLGLSLSDLDPATNDIITILKRLNKANFTAADAATMFRARTAGAMITLVSSVDSIEEYVAASKELSGITEMIAERQMKTLEGRIKGLEDMFQQLSITAGENLTNSINNLADAFGLLGKRMEGLGMPENFLGSIEKLNSILSPIIMATKWLEYLNIAFIQPQKVMDEWESQIAKFPEALNALTGSVDGTAGALGTYKTALDEVLSLRGQMSAYITEEARATKEYQQLLFDLASAEVNLANAENGVINTSGDLLDVFYNQNPAVAQLISQYTNYRNAVSKTAQLQADIASYTEEQIELGLELSRVTSIYGADSEQARAILNQYRTVTRLLSSAKEELTIQSGKENEAEKLYSSLLDGMPPQIRAVAEAAIELIELRSNLIRTQTEYNSALEEYNRYLDIQQNREKYLSEAYLNLYEAQDKLWEIESKRLKLKEDEEEKGQDLFDALAEQGLLTDDIIQQYIEWQEAEGELMEARAAFARGEITEEELAKYIENARKEYEDYAGVVIDENGNIDESQSGVAISWADDIIDAGAASSDIIDIFYDLLDLSNEEEQTLGDWETAVAAVNNALSNIKSIELVDQQTIDDAKIKVDDLKSAIEQAFIDMGNYKIPDDALKSLEEGAVYSAWFTLTEGQKNSIISDLNAIKSLIGGFLVGLIWDSALKFPATILALLMAGAIYVYNAITSGLGNIWEFLISIPNNLWNAIRNVASQIWNSITSVFTGWIPGFATGGIVKAQKGKILKGPEVVLAGEAGDEAFIPLEGTNKKHGKKLLQYIIPRYFPELQEMQTGGIIGDIGDIGEIRGIIPRLDGVIEPITKLMGLFKLLIIDLTNAVNQLKEMISTNLSTAINSLKEVILNMTTGITTAIESAVSTITTGGNSFRIEVENSTNIFKAAMDELAEKFKNIQISYGGAGGAVGGGTGGGTAGGGGTRGGGGGTSVPDTIATISGGKSSRPGYEHEMNIQSMQGKSQKLYFKPEEDDAYINYLNMWTKRIGEPWPFAKGGMIKQPTLSMLGEAGPEAVIPLRGINKKYGERLLEYIIPKYYPDLVKMQYGGIVGGSYDYSTANNENYTITGPVYVTGVESADDFAERLKFRMRASK